MSKLYRSLLFSGVVAAGVAACGDDVTVTPPATPTPTVHSVSVGPTGVTLNVGQTLQMIASVNADAGVATTVTWSINAPGTVATISATGLLTAVGAGNVAVQACATANTSVCGNATVVISTAPAATVQQVNVTPATAFIVKPATGSTSLQLSAAVIGTNNPAQTVTWSLPGSPANASISATGLLTVTSAIAGGTINVSACSTVTGYTNVCGFSAVTIQVPVPATVSISSITWVPTNAGTCVPATGAVSVPVTLTSVRCQIEVTANVNAGDTQLQRLDVIMGGQVVASQTFPGTSASSGENASVSAPVDVTLSINTQQLRRPTGSTTLFVPVLFNGNTAISLNLYTSSSATPLASQATPVVMSNPDAALKNGAAFTLVNNSSSPSYTNISGTWFTGTQSGGSIQYISFSTLVPTALSFTSTGCGGTSTSNTITGTATTGIVLAGNWTCAAFEGSNSITGVTFPATLPAAVGPDGTPAVSATAFSNVASAFTLPTGATTTESRWNMVNPGTAPTASNAVLVDNKAPVITLLPVGFLSGGAAPFNCETTGITPGCWINGSYNIKNRISVTSEAGTGENTAARVTMTWTATGVAPFYACSAILPTGTGADFAETTTANLYHVCARTADNIGNVSNTPQSNGFSVDLTAPTLAYVGGYAVSAVNPPEVNVLPLATSAADTINFSLTDNNSGVDATVGLTVAFTRTLNNGGVVSTSACANPTNTLTGSGTTPQFMLSPVLISSCTLPGERKWSATGQDRAGNSAGPINRQLEYNPAIPVINAINIIPNYAAAVANEVDVLATDDEDLQSAEMWLHTTTNVGNDIRVVFGPKANLFKNIWGADWDASLFLKTTLAVNARLSLPANYALAGYVENTGAITQVQSATDSISVNVYDTFGAASGATTIALNPAFVTATSYASSNPWSAGLGNIIAAAINTVGSTCNFEYSTPTNNPEVLTRIWIVNENAGQFTLLADVNTTPTLISDNGIQRLYRYSVSGSATCANAGGTGVAANNIIAIKSNVGAIIF